MPMDLTRLRQRLEEQLQQSSQWIRKVQELEGRLANAQTQLAQMAQLEQSLDNLRRELAALVEKADERWGAIHRDGERARLLEREAQGRAMTEIRKELEALPKLSEELEARQAEDQRLNRTILELRSKMMEVQDDLTEKVNGRAANARHEAHRATRGDWR
jgi:DNA repair ATPase RecN